jgi:hypothetical protein
MSTRIVLEGTEARDRIDVSTETSAYEILGLGGNDEIYGGLGGDWIDGGDGHDFVDAGDGDDTVIASSGVDALHGGAGFDTLLGSAADDRVTLLAFSGFEMIDLGDGVDVLAGENRNDRWDLSAVTLIGVELIDLGSGWNRFVGSAGDDTITAGAKNDIIDGGGGTDTFRYAGLYADYAITGAAGSLTVTGPDGKDSLTSIERLSFSDGVWQDGVFIPDDGGGDPVNRAPVAEGDSYTTAFETAVVLTPLLNDSDPDGDPVALVSFDAPGNGVVSFVNGQWTYTPQAGWSGVDSFGYTITDGALEAAGGITVTVAPQDTGGGGGTPGATFWEKLSSIPEGGWGALNLNAFSDVWPAADDAAVEGTPERVLLAWSSMAWDSNRSDLIFWGGGHANYSGNEVYRFDTDTLMWERASLPSRVVNTANDLHLLTADGPFHSPIAAHTYDNSEFLPIADRFVTFGGGAYGSGGAFVVVDETDGSVRRTGPYFWDPDSADPDKVGGLDGSGMDPTRLGGQMWENRDAIWNPDVALNNFVNGATAYTQIDGKDVLYVSTRPNGGLYKYTVNDVEDASLDTWEQVGRGWEGISGAGSGALDPVENVFVRSANATFTYWDLDTAGVGNRNVNFTPEDLTGGFSMDALTGMDFDPKRGAFMLWDGHGDVWAMESPDSLAREGWTVRRLDGPATPSADTPDVDASDDIFTGVLGKWKYIPDLDIFLGVYDTEDVWAYKPLDWDPTVLA